ncbi:MAG: DUF3667 domain-containing protein, partial [Bacteroidota bacterium]
MELPENTIPETVECTNCGGQMLPQDAWCPGCGQKAYDGPPSFRRLLSEFFETVFSLDNKLFRTFKNLVYPGRLTNYYLRGKQKPFFNPLRLFFFSGVLMVAAYSFYTTQQVGDSMDRGIAKERNKAYKHKFCVKLSKRIDSIQASFPGEKVELATDSLLSLMDY